MPFAEQKLAEQKRPYAARTAGRLAVITALQALVLTHAPVVADDGIVNGQDRAVDRESRLQDDLVLHYAFDDDDDGQVYDQSGHENHGYPVGPVKYGRSFSGQAPIFSSYQTYIVCDKPGLNMHGWKQTTVSVWIKTHRLTTYGRIISRGEVTGETTSGVRLRAGGKVKATWGITRQYRSNAPTPETLHSSSLNPPNMDRVGKWVHLVGTFDGDFLRLYVNGELDREVEVASRNLTIWDRPTQKLVIGNAEVKSRLSWQDKYFDGMIDEVMIWKRSISESEIAALYEQGADQVRSARKAARAKARKSSTTVRNKE